MAGDKGDYPMVDDPWTTLSVSVPTEAVDHLRKLLDVALMLNGFGDCRFIIGPVYGVLGDPDGGDRD